MPGPTGSFNIRWAWIEQIGEGGQGTVHKVRDQNLFDEDRYFERLKHGIWRKNLNN